MVKTLIIVIPIFIAVYIVITFVPPYLNNSHLESSIDEMIEKIDGTMALDLNAAHVRSKVIRLATSHGITLKEEDVEVTWDRDGDEILLMIDFDVTYTYSLLARDTESNVRVHKEKTIMVDVREELRRVRAREEAERRSRKLAERYQRDMEADCARKGGEWNGRKCIITQYIFVPGR